MSDHSRIVEQKGVYYVGYLAGELGYLFRQIKEHDKGVDAEIELIKEIGLQSPILGVQVKARSKFRITTDNEISVTVTEQNLTYWKSFGRPVILAAYSDDRHEVYWTRVDNASSRTIRISLEQKFDTSTLQAFPRIISQYYANFSKNIEIKTVSEILTEFGSTIGEVLSPIEQKLEKAETLLSHGKFKEAATIYRALVTIYEDAPLIWHNLGICLLSLNEYKQAYDIAIKLFEKYPDNLEACNLLGSSLAGVEQYEQAEKILLTALKKKPFSVASSMLWNSLGLLHYWQGRNAEAIEEFSVAATYDPNDHNVFFNLALCSIATSEYTKALEYFDKCIANNPHNSEGLLSKGLLLSYLWRLWEALDYYDRAIQLNPRDYRALYNSADLLKDLGKDERAIQRFHMALDEIPESSLLHYNLGLLYCRKKDRPQAAYHFYKSNKIQENTFLFDFGYEVAYFVIAERTGNSICVKEIQSIPQFALFYGDNNPMRKYLKKAHSINQPILPKDPRQRFAPDNRNNKLMTM